MDETGSRLAEIIERLKSSATNDPKALAYLSALEAEAEKIEQKKRSDAELIQKYEEAYQKLTAPANKIGVFVRQLEDGLALVALGDGEYVAEVDPNLDPTLLRQGVPVRVNQAYAIIGTVEPTATGALVKVSQVLPDHRLRIGTDQQNQAGRLVHLSEDLKAAKVSVGDEVRLDPSGKIAIEHFVKADTQEFFVEQVPETPWSAIGGQETAINLIRETIEQPLLHPEVYEKFDKKPVKGILLYGPPGCGKTLIGKAVAYNLAKEYSARTGAEHKECFMHISGPKVLNMWLGETERMVREIFATAREKAKEGRLVVLFVDEAESILRTRSSGRWLNISNTVVPQFCAEMDGMVGLENVVLILTSNRPDYIDPAVLRPERIDRKVRIGRPTRDQCRQILSIYLHESLPIDPDFSKQHDGDHCARQALIESTLAALWKETKPTEFLRVQTRSGQSETLHWHDFVSGAIIKSVVDRAKDTAIRRAIADPGTKHGLTAADLEDSLAAEFKENEIFPKTDAVEDWLKLLDIDTEAVVSVKPAVATKGDAFVHKSVI